MEANLVSGNNTSQNITTKSPAIVASGDTNNDDVEHKNVTSTVPPLNMNAPKTSSHMPFIYFVVAENKNPVQVSLLDGSSQACHHAIKARKRFLKEKKAREKRYQATQRIIKEQNSFLGFCLGPAADGEGSKTTSITDDVNRKSAAEREESGNSNFQKQTRFYGLDDFDVRYSNDPCPVDNVKKSNNIINLQLNVKNQPIRVPSAQLTTDRESPSKKVQFTKENITRRSTSKNSLSSTRFPSRSSLRSRSESRISCLDKQNLNDVINVTPQRHGNKHEMALPKIDLVGDVYDDVIIKTIDTFMNARNISAKRRPEMHRRLISRLAMTRKYQMEVDAKIRQNTATTHHCSRASDYPDVMSPEQEVVSKPLTVKPTAFQMVSPGVVMTR